MYNYSLKVSLGYHPTKLVLVSSGLQDQLGELDVIGHIIELFTDSFCNLFPCLQISTRFQVKQNISSIISNKS